MADSKPTKTAWANAFDVKRVSEKKYLAVFPQDFCYGTRAHGGMLTALAFRAMKLYLRDSKNRPDLADVLDSKIHFVRMATSGAITVTVEELATSKTSAVAQLRLDQNGKLNMVVLATSGNLLHGKGPTLDTRWRLDPLPHPADTNKMIHDEDPNWVSYQVPWRPKSFLTYLSHAKLFFPVTTFANPSIRDLWMAAVDDDDASFGWTNDHLPYVADLTFSPLENWQGEQGVGSNDNMVRMALAQKADREAGKPLREKSTGLSPFTSFSTSMNIDVKKRLPEEGVKWLFTRTSSRLAKDGRMDWDITVHDESGDLIAVAYMLHQMVELKDIPLPGVAKGQSKPMM